MNSKLYAADLVDLGACQSAVALFRREYPNGCDRPTTAEDILVATNKGLFVEWLVVALAPPALISELFRQKTALWSKYVRSMSALRQRAAIWAQKGALWDEYTRQRAALWVEILRECWPV